MNDNVGDFKVSRSMIPAVLLLVASVAGTPDTESREADSATGALMQHGIEKKLPVYRPPRRGAPATRVGGGTRGAGSTAPVVQVLAPEDTGLTLQAQPDLYWYVSGPAQARFEFALITETELETVIESQLDTAITPGIQKISLSDLGVELSRGVVYQWSVALVQDAEHRSGDIVASGTIERTDSEIVPEITQVRGDGAAQVIAYAEHGLWYDAISTVSVLISREPTNLHYRQQRAVLLEQVGLQEIAASDRVSER